MRGTYRQCRKRLNVECQVDLTRNQSNRPFQYREHRDRPVSPPLGALLLFPLRFYVGRVFDRMDSEMQRRTVFRSKQELKKAYWFKILAQITLWKFQICSLFQSWCIYSQVYYNFYVLGRVAQHHVCKNTSLVLVPVSRHSRIPGRDIAEFWNQLKRVFPRYFLICSARTVKMLSPKDMLRFRWKLGQNFFRYFWITSQSFQIRKSFFRFLAIFLKFEKKFFKNSSKI